MVSDDRPLVAPALVAPAYANFDHSNGSDEDYESDEDITVDMARQKMTQAIIGANKDLASLPDEIMPTDENYNITNARPCLGVCKMFVVQASEAVKLFSLARGEFPSQDNRVQAFTTIYHHMRKEDRVIGPRVLITLSLILEAYLTCFSEGRLEHLEYEEDDTIPGPSVTIYSRFQMHYVRASPTELRTTYDATGHELLEMLVTLKQDVDGALVAVGQTVPVTWRVLAPHLPHIAFAQQGDTQMQDEDSDSDVSD